MGMSCLDCHDYMDGYNRGKREDVIGELEKIKQEMTPDSDDFWRVANATPFIKIIDKHIEKLKGE